MRTTKTLLSLLLCLTLLFGLSGCSTPTPAPVEPESASSVVEEAPAHPSAAEQYAQAAQPLREAKNLKLELETKKTVVVGADTFEENVRQKLILAGLGTDAFTASVEANRSIGDFNSSTTEYYENDTLYFTPNQGNGFRGAVTEAEYLARIAPAALLDETLYGSITAEEGYSGVTMHFTQPTAAESWALPAGAEFLHAEGLARFGFDGALSSTQYTIEYRLGNTSVTVEITAKAAVQADAAPKAPADPAGYTEVESVEAVRLFDDAAMYLYSAETVSAVSAQSAVSQAANYYLTEQISLQYTGTGKAFAADSQYDAVLSDGVSVTDTYSQTETFRDGAYAYSDSTGAADIQSDITPADMLVYLQENYLLPPLQNASAVTAEEIGGLLYVELTLDEAWGLSTAEHTSQLIFGDGAYLDGFATAYENRTATGYMTLDPATGFPTAAGMTFAGVHTIDGAEYVLGLDIAQSYRLSAPAVYEDLIGEPLPEAAPETPATPLLYRVTGADGGEMYLMGTIHVGDARTAYLPDEVYAALDASDALAVECDMPAFEEAVETDPQLAAQVAATYMNANGVATKTLLDEATYNKAVKLLKASGNFSSTAEYMTPYIWSSSIDNFYLTLGQLDADKGMDVRLLQLAKEQNKKILEVESALFQMQMSAEHSPELQLMMLESSLETTAAEYCADVQALYELWCTGDEAALRAELDEVPTDITEEELALQQEYLDTVIIRRNEGMLKKATAYLESGDTVFFAVGLAHLLQENGLVDTLRDAGYTVEQVAYNG